MAAIADYSPPIRMATPNELEAVSRLKNDEQKSPRSKSPPQRPRYITGSNPNVFWKDVSDEQFRAHPRVLPLPPVDGVTLAGPDTFLWVRQDDPLWDELHRGVLTSRHLLSSLGLREPRAAKLLGLGKGMWTPGAIENVWMDLSRPAPAGRLTRPPAAEVAAAHAANTELREALRASMEAYSRASSGGASDSWPPAAEDAAELTRLREAAAHFGGRSLGSVRCAWGSAQEASALCALLDALPEQATIEEVGMAVMNPEQLPTEELREQARRGELPPIGASPDAMLRPAPGAPLETVEVKNVCPFFDAPGARYRRQSSSSDESPDAPPSPPARRFAAFPRYLTAEERENVPFWQLKGPHGCIPPQYVPQVQVEMLATGASAATYVSCSATQGMHLIRMPRDDEYCVELLHFLSVFWTKVRDGERPSDDLFWSGHVGGGKRRRRRGRKRELPLEERARYERFVLRTRELGEATAPSQVVERPWRRRASAEGRLLFLEQ